MSIRKTLTGIVLVAAIGLSGCGKSDNSNANQNYNFQRQPTAILEVPATMYRGSAISAVDWDKDGDLDMLATEGDGRVFVYKNENGQFYKSQNPIAQVPATIYRGSAISAADWDGDGKIDILATDNNGSVHVYKNTGE